MSKYKLTDKYTVNSESTGLLGGARKYKRKSKGDLHPRSRSLSLGAVTSPKFTVVEIPSISPTSTKPVDFLQLTQMNSKVNPYTYDQMYGYKVVYILLFEPHHEKTCFCLMRTTKAQISLRICAV